MKSNWQKKAEVFFITVGNFIASAILMTVLVRKTKLENTVKKFLFK